MGRERPNIGTGSQAVKDVAGPGGYNRIRAAPSRTHSVTARVASAALASLAGDADTAVSTLANGVRVVAIREPHLETASASVFVRSGSQHESKRANGISHVVEHMAFKGTESRDCQQINLDAERLGAEVNAHTDKDHTAYHLRGLARVLVAAAGAHEDARARAREPGHADRDDAHAVG